MFSKLIKAGTLLSTTKTEKMNATTIEHYLSGRCRGQFMGVFSSDTLPTSIKKRPAIIVCNTDPSFEVENIGYASTSTEIDAESSLIVSDAGRVECFAPSWIDIA